MPRLPIPKMMREDDASGASDKTVEGWYSPPERCYEASRRSEADDKDSTTGSIQADEKVATLFITEYSKGEGEPYLCVLVTEMDGLKLVHRLKFEGDNIPGTAERIESFDNCKDTLELGVITGERGVS